MGIERSDMVPTNIRLIAANPVTIYCDWKNTDHLLAVWGTTRMDELPGSRESFQNRQILATTRLRLHHRRDH